MPKVPVWIVHDEVGSIVSIARPATDANVIVLSGEGQSVLETEVEQDSIVELVAGGHRVDRLRKAVVAY
jgi:hypothetical protein